MTAQAIEIGSLPAGFVDAYTSMLRIRLTDEEVVHIRLATRGQGRVLWFVKAPIERLCVPDSRIRAAAVCSRPCCRVAETSRRLCAAPSRPEAG